MQDFKFKTATESLLLDVSWNEAQKWCNFVLFKPNWLPQNMKEILNKIRSESPNECSTHRLEYHDGNRALSIKQFLYDFAPPAYDHPCLWRNAEMSTPENTPLPRPHLIGNNYLWFGLDYRRKPAATINIMRTQIEITTLDGAFDNQEIVQIVSSMVPVDNYTKDMILQTSFAELMHNYRHKVLASDVPIGYFEHSRSKKFHCFPQLISSLEITNSTFPGQWLINNKINNYKLDSILLFGMNNQNIEEAEYYFESVIEPGSYIRFLVTYKRTKHVIQYPPRLSDQECNSATHQLQNGVAVYHAWSKTNENGSHSLVFEAKNEILNCIIKPAPWTIHHWAVELCYNILR